MNPNKHQVCNILGLDDDPYIWTRVVKPMTHARDNASVVFSFVLEQVSLNRIHHNPLSLQSYTWL